MGFHSDKTEPGLYLLYLPEQYTFGQRLVELGIIVGQFGDVIG